MYNERALIADTIAQLTDMCTRISETTAPGSDILWELIFSNDGSRDHCEDIVTAAAQNSRHRIVLVGSADNHGKGAAIRTGIAASGGDIVAYTDCDLAYGTEQLADLILAHLASGADITIGSRSLHPDGYAGYTRLRKLASRIYMKILASFCGCKVSDSQAGIKCFRGSCARKVFAQCTIDRFAFDLEALSIASALGYDIAQYPVCILRSDESLGRTSRVKLLRDTFRMLKDLFKIKKHLREIRRTASVC